MGYLWERDAPRAEREKSGLTLSDGEPLYIASG
jgi:hypothetical protein